MFSRRIRRIVRFRMIIDNRRPVKRETKSRVIIDQGGRLLTKESFSPQREHVHQYRHARMDYYSAKNRARFQRDKTEKRADDDRAHRFGERFREMNDPAREGARRDLGAVDTPML